MNKYILFEYYVKYLRDIRKVSESSIGHYTQALRKISKILVQDNKINESIYEIKDLSELEIIKDYLYSNPDFVSLDERGHRMYSSGLNNYYRFACGDEFFKIKDEIITMDIAIPKSEHQTAITSYWKRSSIIKQQSIKSARYLCEIDSNHKTFTAKNTGEQYMEGHHAIPMKKQESFDVSLDVYANIICLCPICHRLLHYGEDCDKDNLLNKIYYDRADRLASSGIRLSKEEFVKQIV